MSEQSNQVAIGCDYCDNIENITTLIDKTGERPDIHICRDCYASGQEV